MDRRYCFVVLLFSLVVVRLFYVLDRTVLFVVLLFSLVVVRLFYVCWRPDGNFVCCFVIFSSSCQTLCVLDRRYCLLFFSSSWSELFMFWTDGIGLLFSLVVVQTLLCFGQTVLFVKLSLVVVRLFYVLDRRYCLLFSLVVVRLFYVLDRRYCLLFCYFL